MTSQCTQPFHLTKVCHAHTHIHTLESRLLHKELTPETMTKTVKASGFYKIYR